MLLISITYFLCFKMILDLLVKCYKFLFINICSQGVLHSLALCLFCCFYVFKKIEIYDLSVNCLSFFLLPDLVCDLCKDSYFNLDTANSQGCRECDCNDVGKLNPNCDKLSGQCQCRGDVVTDRVCVRWFFSLITCYLN